MKPISVDVVQVVDFAQCSEVDHISIVSMKVLAKSEEQDAGMTSVREKQRNVKIKPGVASPFIDHRSSCHPYSTKARRCPQSLNPLDCDH